VCHGDGPGAVRGNVGFPQVRTKGQDTEESQSRRGDRLRFWEGPLRDRPSLIRSLFVGLRCPNSCPDLRRFPDGPLYGGGPDGYPLSQPPGSSGVGRGDGCPTGSMGRGGVSVRLCGQSSPHPRRPPGAGVLWELVWPRAGTGRGGECLRSTQQASAGVYRSRR
jgi:hypothetical protein